MRQAPEAMRYSGAMARPEADLIISEARQLLTMSGDGRPGSETSLGLVERGAVAMVEGRIVMAGPTQEVRTGVTLRPGGREISAYGKVVMPGFVDPHTHPVFMGSREDEFEMRNQGVSYMEIAARGGGIRRTVEAVRQATATQLEREARRRLDRMLLHGTTTAEAKSGYALETAGEIRLLEIILELDRTHPMDLVPTFLGAHEFPPEFDDDREAYVDLLVEEMIPRVAERKLARFCDVFCEAGVFTTEQSRRILETGQRHGMIPKLHAEEFANTGGAELGAELGAASVDHLGAISHGGILAIQEAGVVPVVLPGTAFHLGLAQLAPARTMFQRGLPVALGTDLNPGSSPTESLQMIASIAATQFKLTAAEILAGITLHAAMAVGLAEEVGSLAPGKRGDVVILDMPSFRYLPYHYGVNHVSMVVKRGKVVVEEGRLVH